MITITIPQPASFSDLQAITLGQWQSMPTLHAGHFDDLKFDDGTFRVRTSRMRLADYGGDAAAHAKERLTFEKLIDGVWKKLDVYGRIDK